MHSNTTEPLGQVTGPPHVTLVDLDGFAVPDCERHTPVPGRPPCPADSWPAWTDMVVVELGRRDPSEHPLGAARMADAYAEVMERADAGPAEEDGNSGDDDRRIPRGAVLVPPELEPEYKPTAEDLAEYGAWLETLDREQLMALAAPIAGGAPAADDWPRLKTAAERRRDMEDVREWYAAHPGG